MASVVSWIGLALAVIGLGLVALMAVVGWIRRGDRARLQRLSETPVSSIRDALDGTVTKLRGRVVAGTEPLARPAFGGVPLVWYRADVAKLVSDVGWVDVFTDRGLADFFLEDGSGERARRRERGGVRDAARGLLRRARGHRPRGSPLDAPSAHARDRAVAREPGARRPHLPGERLVARGRATVTVLGRAERERGELVLHRPAPKEPLAVYAMEETALQNELAERARNRLVLLVVGAILLAVGIVAVVVG
jgi:hypothetical protein